jgi:hypothetical protein
MIKNPCYKCSKRTMNCHSGCQEYKSFFEEERKRKDAIIALRNKESIYDSYSVNKVKRLKKNKER